MHLAFRLPTMTRAHMRWSHGTNSQRELAEALEDDEIMLVEADVIVGSAGDIVMAHPPQTTSDLPLRQFLERIHAHNEAVSVKGVTKCITKGIKLDFKHIAAVRPGLQLLKQVVGPLFEVSYPVFLNADILCGPGSAPVHINADEFVSSCLELGPPCAVLSLGWTVSSSWTPWRIGYDVTMVSNMLGWLVCEYITSSLVCKISLVEMAFMRVVDYFILVFRSLSQLSLHSL